MFFKKLMVVCLAATAISTSNVTAYAEDTIDCIKIVNKSHAGKKKHEHKSLDSLTSEQLKELAEKYNIDATGLTDEQLKEKLKELKPKHHRFDKMTSSELKSLAEKFNIDTTDLTDEQIKEKINQTIKEKKSKQE